MLSSLRRVCVTGPESTGKTTLAQGLAEWGKTEWVRETSRLYAERKGTELLASDVDPIAREHIAAADEASGAALAVGRRLLVLDTDLVSTMVYGAYYYGEVPEWVHAAEWARRADLYLLCDVDVPWIPDGIRDRPLDRDAMFALFDDALASRGANVVRLQGSWSERWDAAVGAVGRLLDPASPA